MSLTSFLKEQDVRERFAAEFPLPPFDLNAPLKAPPLTKRYSLVGTAFDYLMRFHLKRFNPGAKVKPWVAEHAAEMMPDSEHAHALVTEAKKRYGGFLKDGKLTDGLAEACIWLGQIDPFYRAGYLDPNLGQADPDDIRDLRSLAALLEQKVFEAREVCLLNPTFGDASTMIGGADADFLIDGLLVDIKTTKYLTLEAQHFHQLAGYPCLHRIGGLAGLPKKAPITELAIYFARHGVLHRVPVETVIVETKMSPFLDWMRARARQSFPEIRFVVSTTRVKKKPTMKKARKTKKKAMKKGTPVQR